MTNKEERGASQGEILKAAEAAEGQKPLSGEITVRRLSEKAEKDYQNFIKESGKKGTSVELEPEYQKQINELKGKATSFWGKLRDKLKEIQYRLAGFSQEDAQKLTAETRIAQRKEAEEKAEGKKIFKKEKEIELEKNLERIVEAYEEADTIDRFKDYMLRTSDMAMTKEKVNRDPAIKEYLTNAFAKTFPVSQSGPKFESFLEALPTEMDYIQLASKGEKAEPAKTRS